MITDKELVMSDGQAVTVTAPSTNVIDLSTSADIGRGPNMRFLLKMLTAALAAGAATLQAQLVSSAAADLSSPTVLYDTGAVAKANLAAGAIIADIVVPRTAGRYLGVLYTVATGPLTAGSVIAELLLDTPTPQADRVLGVTGR